MSKTLATRIAHYIAKVYGPSAAMSAVSNASEAVVTLAAGHSVVAGDWLEITSGWQRLSGRIVRAKSVSTNDVTLEGINTSSTSKYNVGGGVGSIRRITAWDQITQINDVQTAGGEQQWADGTSLDDEVEIKIPTIKSARTMTLKFFDDPLLPWYATVAAASDTTVPTALMIAPPNGSKIVANAYWSLAKEPDVAKNTILGATISLSFSAESTRYAS